MSVMNDLTDGLPWPPAPSVV